MRILVQFKLFLIIKLKFDIIIQSLNLEKFELFDKYSTKVYLRYFVKFILY